MATYTGIIYKLIGNDHYYYGSTINSLEMRYYSHKYHPRNTSSFVYLYFDSIGWENVSIEKVDEITYINYNQLLEEENKYIIKHYNDPLCLNTKLAIRDKNFVRTINKKLSHEQIHDYRSKSTKFVSSKNPRYNNWFGNSISQ